MEEKQILLNIINSWNNINENNIQNELRMLQDFVKELLKKKWDRKGVYLLLQEVLESEKISEEAEIVIWDFETALTGSVAPECIYRFPDENNMNLEELVAYVRSKKWLLD